MEVSAADKPRVAADDALFAIWGARSACSAMQNEVHNSNHESGAADHSHNWLLGPCGGHPKTPPLRTDSWHNLWHRVSDHVLIEAYTAESDQATV